MHSEAFYLAIPSTNADLISVKAQLDEKVALINLLSDIALTQKALRKQKKQKNSANAAQLSAAAVDPHPLDEKYTSLGCGLKKVSKKDPVWKGVNQYFKASLVKKRVKDPYGMSGFSKRYGDRVKVLEVFEMTRDGEAAAYEQHAAKQGRTLLWHGTNIAVAAAICSSGMRIMPNSGGRVGKGIYLANQSAKSGHYVQPAADGTGVMFLAEAAMGTPSCIMRDDPRLKKAPAGADSVIAQGLVDPDPSGDIKVDLGGREVTMPAGALRLSQAPGAQPGSEAANGGRGTTFIQSEHLIYEESQVRLRYLVKMQWSSSADDA